MSTQSYNTTKQGEGTQVNLGTSDDLLVGKHGLINNTDQSTSAEPTIIGTGSGHHAEIFGTVSGHFEALRLGIINEGHDQYVKIGGTGRLLSDRGDALAVYGSHSTVVNNGIIDGGAIMWGDDKNTHSTIDNNGTITASGGAIVLNGEEQFKLVNTGNITSTLSDLAFYAAASHKSSDITNSGQIVGDIIFGRGADVYDGRGGTIKGLVAGEAGEDILTGGDHRDHFNGGHGHDILTGGKGADVFSYSFASDSTNGKFRHDVITDFSHAQGDRLDLHIIDAIDGGTDDAFTFIGQDAFDGHAGQLHFGFHGGNTLVAGDTDGDGRADFTIELQGHIDLVQGDFHL